METTIRPKLEIRPTLSSIDRPNTPIPPSSAMTVIVTTFALNDSTKPRMRQKAMRVVNYHPPSENQGRHHRHLSMTARHVMPCADIARQLLTGDDQFYEKYVPTADKFDDEHREELRKEGLRSI